MSGEQSISIGLVCNFLKVYASIFDFLQWYGTPHAMRNGMRGKRGAKRERCAHTNGVGCIRCTPVASRSPRLRLTLERTHPLDPKGRADGRNTGSSRPTPAASAAHYCWEQVQQQESESFLDACRYDQGVTVFGTFLRGKNATRRTKSEREEVFIEQTR